MSCAENLILLGVTTTLATLISGLASASLVFDHTPASAPTGLGTRNNILTLEYPAVSDVASETETGKVAHSPTTSGDVLTNASPLLQIVDRDENPSAPAVGTEFFDPVVSVYNPFADRSVIFSDSPVSPVQHASPTNPGAGGDDFAYALGAAGIMVLNSVLPGIGDFSAFRIGLRASVSYIDGGPDIWTIRSKPFFAAAPEPGVLGLLGISFVALRLVRRRNRKAAVVV